jgi:hypothetical protein
VVEVRRERDVPECRDAIRDVAHVGGDAEHLHPDEHAAAAPARGRLRQVAGGH